MTTDPRRPQDVGRRHRRRPTRAAPDTLLERYHEAMRAELGDVLEELRPPAREIVTLLDGSTLEAPPRPPIADRSRLWDLAIKLGRELGAELEAPIADPEPEAASAPAPRRARRRIAFE